MKDKGVEFNLRILNTQILMNMLMMYMNRFL